MTEQAKTIDVDTPEIVKEYEAIEEILKQEKYSSQKIKERILTIGYKLEKVFKETGSEFLISDITSIILKSLKRRGLGHLRATVWTYFNDFPQWKNSNLEHSTSRGTNELDELPEEFSIALEQVDRSYHVIAKSLDINRIADMKLGEQSANKIKRTISNLRDKHDDVTDKFKTLYKEKGWSSVEDNWSPLTESEKLQQSERNHIKKPPKIAEDDNPAHLGMKILLEQLKRVDEKLVDWPIEDREKSVRIGESLECLARWFRPMVDNKWRADHFQWIQIVLGLKHYSIHKMSNMTRTRDIYGKLRHITKEQISDNKQKILQFNYELMKKIPGFFELSLWFQEASLPYRKELTNATRPKLQAAA